MSRKRRSGATGGPSGSCHRAGIHKKGSLVLDAFAPSSPNLPALIQLAGIIVQPVTQTLFSTASFRLRTNWRRRLPRREHHGKSSLSLLTRLLPELLLSSP